MSDSTSTDTEGEELVTLYVCKKCPGRSFRESEKDEHRQYHKNMKNHRRIISRRIKEKEKCNATAGKQTKDLNDDNNVRMAEVNKIEPPSEDYHGSPGPLLNQYILTTIFNYLKTPDLKTCRLICKTWNDEAVRIFPNKMILRIPCISMYIGAIAKIQKCVEVFKTCTHREWLLRNVKIVSNIFSVIETEIVRTFFQEYGTYFTYLEFSPHSVMRTHSVKIQDTIIYNVLTSWCPNITHLEIVNNHPWLYNVDQLQELKTSAVFKLQSFRMNECDTLPNEIRFWISSVLNQSPGLKSLRSFTIGEVQLEINKTIFENMVAFPNIARNLENLNTTFLNNEYQNKFLSEMCCLKQLKIEGELAHELSLFPPIKCFSNIKHCLKYLQLDNVGYMNDEKIGVISLAEEFPNLEFFKINATNLDKFVPIKLNPRLVVLRQNPHLKLKKLLLMNSYNEISDIEGVCVLVDAFPNLDFLHMDFRARSRVVESTEIRLKLPKVLSILSNLKSLKELVIRIYVEDKSELIGAFPLIIQKFQKLQCISIGLKNKRKPAIRRRRKPAFRRSPSPEQYLNFNLSQTLFFQFGDLLINKNNFRAPNLINIRLVNFKISTPTIEELELMKDMNIEITISI